MTGIATPKLLSQVNFMSACGPQVDSLIYYYRLEWSTLFYYLWLE